METQKRFLMLYLKEMGEIKGQVLHQVPQRLDSTIESQPEQRYNSKMIP